MVAFEITFFIIGLILLLKGSDFFVKSASTIAKKLGVSEFVIGLTLVALGTSIPELASAVFASAKQNSSLIIGNVTGANIANIGLITGIAATIAVIKTNNEIFRRDGYLMLFSGFMLLLVAANLHISRIESIILVLLYIAYMFFLLETKSKFKGKLQRKDIAQQFQSALSNIWKKINQANIFILNQNSFKL